MTAAILSPPFTSTSGLAPVFSITICFWIRVDSLKRPPTLLTIPSSFSSSSMTAPLELTPDDVPHRRDGRLQVVVDHLVAVLAGSGQLDAGLGQAPLNRFLGLGVAVRS